ncbi:hypothetical protein B0J15DRAFT_573945 [Fusarium solani]|uniref:Uncharacterized protein n=1 Tax=Fusarium solani TaxID=169388 RepID=A0A9P9L366_FUSSL|nr:uncharacterized protein B0J15DRAFT_573945 [Fusarium solani]KAH7273109.1 hypothetical protein B0J15DRAFT_573945 [Fusarium solani]
MPPQTQRNMNSMTLLTKSHRSMLINDMHLPERVERYPHVKVDRKPSGYGHADDDQVPYVLKAEFSWRAGRCARRVGDSILEALISRRDMVPESPAHPNYHGIDGRTPLSNNQPLTNPLDRSRPSRKLCQSARVWMILKVKDMTPSDSPCCKGHGAPLRRISNRREKRDPPPEKSSDKVKQVEAPVWRPQGGKRSAPAKCFVSALAGLRALQVFLEGPRQTQSGNVERYPDGKVIRDMCGRILNPSPGLEMVKRLFVENLPVWNTPVQSADVHKVKVLQRPRPIEQTILNDKLDVGRHPRRLDRTQICPDNLCLWKLIPKVDSPDPSPGPNIKNPTGMITNGRKKQLVVERHE